MRAVWVAALVVGLLGTAWVSTDFFRTTWLETRPNQLAEVDQGVATVDGIAISLVEVTNLGATPSLSGSDWQPPAGFHAWRIVLHTESTNENIVTCDVALVDGEGRHFYANYFVDSFVDGYEWSYFCGKPEPDDDIPAEQALLALLPAGAEPLTVRISSSTLNPDYIELEVG